ncbi:hypothetical protein HQ520_00905 [bacterium]|nr:hypothetical protein [bacterium]
MIATIGKVVKRRRRGDKDQARKDLEYWLFRPPAERIAQVELLRQQYYGTIARIQKVVHAVKCP